MGYADSHCNTPPRAQSTTINLKGNKAAKLLWIGIALSLLYLRTTAKAKDVLECKIERGKESKERGFS